MKKHFLFAFLAICAVFIAAFHVSLAPRAQGDEIHLSTDDAQIELGVPNQGWWSNTVSNQTLNRAAFTSLNRRAFFTFLLPPPAAGAVVSATLLQHRGISALSNEATETVGLFDVSTDAVTLNKNNGTSVAIFEDLGTGNSYGQFDISGHGNDMELLEFSLNATAVSNINLSAGGYFSVGASLLSADSADFVFGAGFQPPCILRLVRIPEPTSIVSLLFLASCIAARQDVRKSH